MKVLEKHVQGLILDYLSNLGGFVCKIELSGKPIYRGGKLQLMPFKNKYYRTGMSDILYFYKGSVFCFEVKEPSEHEKIKKHFNRIADLSYQELPKYLRHYKAQYEFIESIKKQGGYGGFVSNLMEVKEILNGN